MDKKILLVHTGGTIGSSYDQEKNCRVLNAEVSDMTLLKEYQKASDLTADQVNALFEDSRIMEKDRTFSENMTLEKLNTILANIGKADINKFCGIIILHGTDTLAYTSALFSFVFSGINIPVMMVSGNRPPDDELSNANANFKTAADLILSGIAPNIYVPYRNSDNSMWLHSGVALKQSANYSEDFYSASSDSSFCLTDDLYNRDAMLKRCKELSENRNNPGFELPLLKEGVLLILPYSGINYSHYSIDNIKAVIHGSYHSGTVCVERNSESDSYSSHSLLWFSEKCEMNGIPVFVAPSKLDSDQYSSVLDLIKNSRVTILDMTTEAAYMKLVLGISLGYTGNTICEFMNKEICNEFIN